MLRKTDFQVLQAYPTYTIITLPKDDLKIILKNYKLFINSIFFHFKDTAKSKPDMFFFFSLFLLTSKIFGIPVEIVLNIQKLIIAHLKTLSLPISYHMFK